MKYHNLVDKHGQGSCKRCMDNGKWNRMWMTFLYEIEGMPGVYCGKCVKELESEEQSNDTDRKDV